MSTLTAGMVFSLAEVIEQSLQPQNQQVRLTQKQAKEQDYRKMLDELDQFQQAREVEAAYALS